MTATSPEVLVDGTRATQVIDVEYENTTGSSIGSATVSVANTNANRSLFKPASRVEIRKNGSTVWSGEVLGKPSNTSGRNLTLDVEAETFAGQAEYGKVTRPFVELSRADIVRQAVDKQIKPFTDTKKITYAETVTDWSANDVVDDLEKTDDSKGINEFGQDTVFVGMRNGSSGTGTVTYDAVPTSAVPGRRVLEVETRLIVNNRGDVFDLSLTVVDDAGIAYTWTIDAPTGSSSKTYKLPVEDATIETGDTPLTARLDAEISGVLPDSRAIAVDMIRTTPFELVDRGTDLTADVDDTDDKITRQVNKSVLSLADDIATEVGATAYVTADQTLRFETQAPSAQYSITDDTSTGVVDVDVDRDFDVKNQVTVSGKDDLQATFTDSSSVQFYNSSVPKPEPITDTSLRTSEQLETRARGFLAENAFEDSAIEFTLAGAQWRDVSAGEVIDVTYPPESINGTFLIDSVGRTPGGFVTIALTGQTEI